MNITRMLRIGTLALSVTLGAGYLAGCAAGYGGSYYGPDVGVGIGVGYYDSPGYYGGWGRGYRVGPWHGDHHWDDGHNDHHDNHRHGSSHHSYRAAPAGRPMPSIPSRGRSRGGHDRSHH